MVSAQEWTNSENILWEPVYSQAISLNKLLAPFLKQTAAMNLYVWSYHLTSFFYIVNVQRS